MRNRWKALLAGVAAACAFAIPATGAQAAQIGQICHVGTAYWVSSIPSYDVRYSMYILGTGAGFRVLGYSGDFYYGRGNALPEGYFPRLNINQSSCYW
ncbi:hypothetical protein [Conexibacter arvalis]|uniref:Uncharacterized protein n=1 Tax=Conexibacter arvalis TaxID=912552 RepID=A0A840IGK4_9ACTN|nr:hypothetical protein [Conexibacter arvalis]MBB4664177.1 hypothetical protein [Conexibacter arvalis]